MNWIASFHCRILAIFVCCSIKSLSDPLDNVRPVVSWKQVATSANLTAVAFGNGKFMAGGDVGILASRVDGSPWEIGRAPCDGINGLTYANGLWVAVGVRGQIATSLDGTRWQQQWSGTADHLNGVTFANGRFVAVGGGRYSVSQSRTILVSKDAVHWTISESTPQLGALWKVTYAKTLFVAVGNLGTLLTSHDADVWQSVTNLPRGRLSGIAYGNDQIVVVGDAGVFSSIDGVRWKTNQLGNDRMLFDVSFGAGRFFATGDDTEVWTSIDGNSWLLTYTGSPAPLSAIAFADGKFVATGQNGVIAESIDASNWTINTSGATPLFRQIAAGKGVLAAIGESSIRIGPRSYQLTEPLVISTNRGTTWTSPLSPTAFGFYYAAFANNRFLAFGRYNSDPAKMMVAQSSDGLIWTVADVAGTVVPRRVAFGNSVFAGIGSQFCVSGDAVIWTATQSYEDTLNDLAFGNGVFVAVGTGGRSYTAADGRNWTKHPQPSLIGTFVDIVYGNGQFVAIGQVGTPRTNIVAVSVDGRTWETQLLPIEVSGQPESLYQLASGGGSFIAVGEFGTLASSSDGRTWNTFSSPSPTSLASVAYDGSSFFAVGNLGTVFQSISRPTLRITIDKQNTVKLSIDGEPPYTLETTGDLPAQTWQDALGITPSGSTEIIPTGRNAFYRLKL